MQTAENTLILTNKVKVNCMWLISTYIYLRII